MGLLTVDGNDVVVVWLVACRVVVVAVHDSLCQGLNMCGESLRDLQGKFELLSCGLRWWWCCHCPWWVRWWACVCVELVGQHVEEDWQVMLQGREGWLLAEDEGEVSIVVCGWWGVMAAAAAALLLWWVWLAAVSLLLCWLAFCSCWFVRRGGLVWLRWLLCAFVLLCLSWLPRWLCLALSLHGGVLHK